jgi:DNA-binding NtrC family response regulator
VRQVKMPLKVVRPELSDIKTLREVEREQIEVALARLRGNITDAAEVLGVAKSTLYRRLESYDLFGKVLEFRKQEIGGADDSART